MFTRIRLKNFRSFSHIEFDLTQKKNEFKRLAIVYGENGMGKSNLADGISALIDLMRTMDVRDMLDSLLRDETFKAINQVLGTSFGSERSDLQLAFRDMPTLVQEYRMIGSTEPIELEYEFLINGRSGKYFVQLDKNEVIRERMEYVIDKRRGLYFDLSETEWKINPRVFQNNEVYKDVLNRAQRFWGKHTLLAILVYEKTDKSERYIKQGMIERFQELMDSLTNLSCYIRSDDEARGLYNNRLNLIVQFEQGIIQTGKEEKLEYLAQSLTHFFKAINSDNRELFYSKTALDGGKIRYQLHIRKFIAGEERDIPFSQESNGNHQLLHIFPYLLSAVAGGTVIIDEIDAGIHDLLMRKIIGDLIPHIQGQLIVTSHNTALMELDSIQSAIYILKENQQAEKSVECIANMEKRIFQQNNIRKRYEENQYNGVPRIGQIDFDALLNFLT